MKLKIYIIVILICSISLILKGDNDFSQVKLDIIINEENTINFKSIEEDEIIKGTLMGKITSNEDNNLHNAKLECDFLGRSYKGRGFSCGFAVVEDLQGYCYIKNVKNEGTLITSWSCNTSAAINGDPNCSGKLNLVQGFGVFAGVSGFGKINMPLAKSINSNSSFPMSLNMKIKYPLTLNKPE